MSDPKAKHPLRGDLFYVLVAGISMSMGCNMQRMVFPFYLAQMERVGDGDGGEIGGVGTLFANAELLKVCVCTLFSFLILLGARDRLIFSVLERISRLSCARTFSINKHSSLIQCTW